MFAEIYRSRVRDWIYGVRATEPSEDTQAALLEDPMTESERLRIIYGLITHPEHEGGAGVTPGKGKWKVVDSVFALHDAKYNREWVKKWSTQYLLQPKDLDEIRDRFGEKIAFYFAFTQSYFTFLAVPAAAGFFAWFALGYFSGWYAIVASLWSVVLVEWWHHQEHDLAARWGVKGVSNIDNRRRDFKHKHETKDPMTGETMYIFPAQDRLLRQLLQIPFAIVAVLMLGTLITLCFGIEIFINEVYSGPGKSVLTFLPTVILTTTMPFLSGTLTKAATQLTDFENYETEAQHERSLTAKIFVLNFVTAYLPLCLTAFIYVPFGSILVPYLDVFALFLKPSAQAKGEIKSQNDPSLFEINPERLRKQVFYFTVTAQIINFLMEVAVPYLKRQGMGKVQEMKAKRSNIKAASADDPAEEKDFLARVRHEADLPAYDVYDDLREMVIQFGYLALFSVVWPLAPVSFLVNNWVELRSDAVKICIDMRRPTPSRAESIGPWLNALAFLSWLGSITMAALVHMFSNDGKGPDGNPGAIKGWALLLTIFFSEHIFLAARWLVATAISKIDSPGKQKERRELFHTRQKYFRESIANTKALPPVGEGQGDRETPITRSALEEEARQGTMRTASKEEQFWSRQRGWQEAALAGQRLIDADVPAELVEGKKEL